MTAFTQNHHAWLTISNGLPANDFYNWHSEIVRGVILTKFVGCADSDLLYISNLRPLYHYLVSHSHNANRLWETLRCCITLRCVCCNAFGLNMSCPSRFLFGSTILHANNHLKHVASEFELLCNKPEPLHFIHAVPGVVLSTIYGNFTNKVACFSRIFSHLIAKGHVKCCLLRDHDRFTSDYLSRLLLPFIFEQLKLI